VDVVAVLTDSANPGAYWRKLKERLKKEGNETVTDCHAFKMTAADGKQRLSDDADAEQLLGNARKGLEEKGGRKVSNRANYKERPESLRRLQDKDATSESESK
jgi:hypothetical protein